MPGSTEFVYIQGKAKWFRHTAPDPWGNWKHDLYLDPPSLEKIRELQTGKDNIQGIKNQLRKDDDGYYMTFRRPTERRLRTGKTVGMAPPEVLMSDGKTPLRDVMVGNGSDITTKLEVYQHATPGGGKAIAARWLSTKVDNLLPFEGNRDFNEDETRAVKGLDKQPAQF